MGAAGGMAGRTVLSLAQQTSLSLLGTLAATAIVAGLQAEWPAGRAPLPTDRSAAVPMLTEGGKFAARAIGASDDAEPFVTLLHLPPVLPLFTAPAVPALPPATSRPDVLAHPDLEGAVAKPSRFASVRRHGPPEIPVPPRREVEAAAVGTPALAGAGPAPAEVSLWGRSKAAYRQVAAWGDALTDRLLP